ncbi:pyruvate kinase alpha/beta domain-containing protein [Geotoga petraea]|uniref:pyruvate kinase alpha/beta domain-containing protein n=1 Tax=Geotoga petraea TaxID=28234 RepID=UPI0021820650|nr:pyruvate kinase alpha/beta domain-containing protein [Geotoga petraea]
MENKIYFLNDGKEKNTINCIQKTVDFCTENHIKKIIINSTTGFTAKKAMETIKTQNLELIFVTHMSGYKEESINEFDLNLKKQIEKNGYKIFTGTHILKGIEASFQKYYNGIYPSIIFADALRTVSQGTKVIIESSIMVKDAGLISKDEWVAVISGSHRGADTSAFIKPSHSNNIKKFVFGGFITMKNKFF